MTTNSENNPRTKREKLSIIVIIKNTLKYISNKKVLYNR
jgi:hypothetical protein